MKKYITLLITLLLGGSSIFGMERENPYLTLEERAALLVQKSINKNENLTDQQKVIFNFYVQQLVRKPQHCSQAQFHEERAKKELVKQRKFDKDTRDLVFTGTELERFYKLHPNNYNIYENGYAIGHTQDGNPIFFPIFLITPKKKAPRLQKIKQSRQRTFVQKRRPQAQPSVQQKSSEKPRKMPQRPKQVRKAPRVRKVSSQQSFKEELERKLQQKNKSAVRHPAVRREQQGKPKTILGRADIWTKKPRKPIENTRLLNDKLITKGLILYLVNFLQKKIYNFEQMKQEIVEFFKETTTINAETALLALKSIVRRYENKCLNHDLPLLVLDELFMVNTHAMKRAFRSQPCTIRQQRNRQPVINAPANDEHNNNLPLDDSTQDEAEECSICFDAFEQAVKTPCNHTFCKECINDWLNKDQSCPMCRKACRAQDLTALKK